MLFKIKTFRKFGSLLILNYRRKHEKFSFGNTKKNCFPKKELKDLETELEKIRKKCPHVWQNYEPASPFESWGVEQEFCQNCGIKRKKI